MAYPAGVQTVTLRLGSSFDSAGTLASISGHVVPMFGAGADHLVWSATGQTYAKVRTNLAWDDTEKVALATVPHPTQAGWKDQTQATFAGWSYQISAIAIYASGERQSFERTYTPQPGDTVVDIDLQPNGAAATPAVVAEWEQARADALAALSATEVEQVTLTDDLAYTLPATVGPNHTHSVVFTQDATGGHTVTYGGASVTVDTTAGASTQIELRPTGAGWAVAYPPAAPAATATQGALADSAVQVGELPSPADAYATSPDPGDIMLMDTLDRVYRPNPLNNRELQRSGDLGSTWETIWTTEADLCTIVGCRQLDSGELLVGVRGNGSTILPALWRTTGYPGGSPVWAKVLEAAAMSHSWILRWAYSCSGSTVIVAPYDGTVPPNRAAKQAVYKSTDDGVTWAEIYDHGPQDGTGSRHIHGAAIDPYRDAIWISLGDSAGNQGIKVSWDGGTVWQTVSTTMQPTAIYAFPECVVFGTDQAPNGVWRIDNPSATSLVVAPAYLIDGGGTALTHTAEQWFRRPGGPLLIPYTVPNSRVTVVLASYDGYGWFELWRSPAAVNASAGARYAVGPSTEGTYIITGPANPGRLRVDVTDRPALISALARMGRHLSMGIPRRSLASFGAVAGQTISNEGNYNNIQLDATGGNLIAAGDPWNLFTLDADGVSVIVNRACRLTVHAHVPFSSSNLTRPVVRVLRNEGPMRTAKMATSTSVTFSVGAGQKIRISATHLSGAPVALEAATSVVQIEAWETYS